MLYIDTMLLPIRYMYSIIQSMALIGIQKKQFDRFFLPTKNFYRKDTGDFECKVLIVKFL